MEVIMSGHFEFDFMHGNFQSLPAREQDALIQHVIRQAHADRAKAMRAALRKPAVWLWNTATWLAKALVRLGAAYVDQRRYGRQVAELQALSDYALKDMGIRRSEIHWVVRHGRELPDLRAPAKPRLAVRADPVAGPAPRVVKPKLPVTATKSAA
jgi:uncharacterized protein YjiS (DUF1127 family)